MLLFPCYNNLLKHAATHPLNHTFNATHTQAIVFGHATESALKRFQASHQLPLTGKRTIVFYVRVLLVCLSQVCFEGVALIARHCLLLALLLFCEQKSVRDPLISSFYSHRQHQRRDLGHSDFRAVSTETGHHAQSGLWCSSQGGGVGAHECRWVLRFA